MTACAFLHPPGLPTAISDLIIGYPGKSGLEPSSVAVSFPIQNRELSILCRKTIEFRSNGTILSFAGDVKHIRKVIAGLEPELEKIDPNRPMRDIGDMINEYLRLQDLGSAVSAVGFSPFPDRHGINALFGYKGRRVSTKFFNEISVSGTGSDWLEKTIVEGDANIAENFPSESKSITKIIGILGYINSKAAFSLAEETDDRSFGGYFEARLSNYKESGTLGKWLHLGFMVHRTWRGLRLYRLPKQLVYDPFTRSITVTIEEENRATNLTWEIQSLSRKLDGYGCENVFASMRDPNHATVFLRFDDEGKQVHRTLDSHEHVFLKNHGNNQFSIDEDFVARLARQGLADISRSRATNLIT